MGFFEKWRTWLLKEIEIEVAAANGISFLGGHPIELLEASTVDEIEEKYDLEDRFLKRFSNLCVSFGFNPEDKNQRDNWEPDEGRPSLQHNSGKLSANFAMRCYKFHEVQKTQSKIARKRDTQPDFFIKHSRIRLASSVAKVLIYAMEKNQKDKKELERLKNYLNGGKLSRDLVKVSKSMNTRIKHHRKYLESDFPVLEEYIIPKPFEKMTAYRVGDNIFQWRSLWINDLYRTLLSEHKQKVEKRISPVEKCKAKEEIFKLGDKEMSKD